MSRNLILVKSVQVVSGLLKKFASQCARVDHENHFFQGRRGEIFSQNPLWFRWFESSEVPQAVLKSLPSRWLGARELAKDPPTRPVAVTKGELNVQSATDASRPPASSGEATPKIKTAHSEIRRREHYIRLLNFEREWLSGL